jgi:hypothetical protein
MARLRGSEVDLTVRPYRMSDTGADARLLTEIRVTNASVDVMHTTVSLTRDDLVMLRRAALEVAGGDRDEARVESTDADLAFEVKQLESPGDVAVSLWEGEPYRLMKGWRFVVQGSTLIPFAESLLAEEQAAAPPGRLP